jgi:hypothetical protein
MVVSTLRGHEAGSKVRCLWAGNVKKKETKNEEGEGEDGVEREILVSGGFDHRLIVWDV